jgi:hypothetical protein
MVIILFTIRCDVIDLENVYLLFFCIINESEKREDEKEQ